MQALIVVQWLIAKAPKAQDCPKQDDSPEGNPDHKLLARRGSGKSKCGSLSLFSRDIFNLGFQDGDKLCLLHISVRASFLGVGIFNRGGFLLFDDMRLGFITSQRDTPYCYGNTLYRRPQRHTVIA